MIQRQFINTLLISILFLGLGLNTVSKAEVPTTYEPDYAEAILYFKWKKYGASYKVLQKLTKQAPAIIEFLEMKALVLKSLNKPKESQENYIDLIKAKKKTGASDKELAPYYFELGVIDYKLKQFARSKKFFDRALEASYNEAPSHFFLGTMAFQQKEWIEAETHFQEVTSGKAKDLRPIAHFYLAQIYLKTKYPSGATHNLVKTKNTSQEIIENKSLSPEAKEMATKLFTSSTKALLPLDQTVIFGNVSLLLGYDTNVLATPETTTSTTSTDQGSITGTFQGSFGLMTSPLKNFQFIPTYRNSINYNLNSDVKSGEFFTHIISMFLNNKPLALKKWGIKLEGTYTFQNNSSSTSRFKFEPYSLLTSGGPYYKMEFKSRLAIGVAAYAGPSKYFDDSSAADSARQSGTVVTSRLFFQFDKGRKFFNPTISAKGKLDLAKGSDNKSQGYGGVLSNATYWSENLYFTLSGEYMITDYSKRSDNRKDNELTIRIAGSNKFSKKLKGVTDISFSQNTSTVPASFSYDRFVFSAGASYSL